MDRKWENVEFEDFIGHLKSTQGHLCFQSGAEEPLFTISLYLVKNDHPGKVRLIIRPESRTPKTIDLSFSRVSQVDDFLDFRNHCVHNRKQFKKFEVETNTSQKNKKPMLPLSNPFPDDLRVAINVSI